MTRRDTAWWERGGWLLAALALVVFGALLTLAGMAVAIAVIQPVCAAEPPPHVGVSVCTPALITVDTWQGTQTVDACMLRLTYSCSSADDCTLVVDAVAPDNLDDDGIFRSGFEAQS